MVKNKASIWIVFVLLGLLWHPLPADPATSLTAKLEPNVILIGSFFNGISLSVSGRVSAENEVLVVMKGRTEDLTLKKKGRALGVLWMNLGEVTFQQVPKIYLLYTSEGLAEFARANSAQWEQLGLGFESFKSKTEITPLLEEKESLIQEFLKLKQSQGLYAASQGAVHFENIDGKLKSYEAAVQVPARIAPGEYEVDVLELHDGTVVATTVEQLKVKEDGLPAILSNLAFKHGTLYGILSVLIAIGAGLLMDFFFGQSKGTH
ncbi:MAG: TIGR02186 family protein [Proteobacteria bacterium]|nr:TIGR02186 family protein [Pseudomonadota bacterium]